MTFSWNGAGDGLRITADAELPYAEGGDPTLVPALAFAYRIDDGATDEAGNSLNGEVDVSFTTMRRISIVQPLDVALTSGIHAGGTINLGVVLAGDNTANIVFKGAMSFDLPGEPYVGAELESASVVGAQDRFFWRALRVPWSA